MSDFTLPTNIKQIGSIGDGLRIYVEDYVCTFLHQYAEAGGYGERLAFLVGRHLMIDGQPILFISGAIHGKHTEEYEGFLRFTEKSRDYAEEMLDEHFPMMEIVGWMQSQPSYGTYLNQHYASYHLRQFRKAYQVMFVLDPIERSNAFYAPDPDARTPSERMAETSGYFIYYEKNTNMHEYMLANKSIDYTAASPTMVEKTPLSFSAHDEESDEEKPTHDPHDEYEDDVPYVDYSRGSRYSMEPEEVIRRHQSEKAKRKAPIAEQRRALNMVASLCAVLFIVTFIMGAWIVRSQDRISEMEQQIRLLNTGYRNLFAQMHAGELPPEDLGPLAPVFVPDDQPIQNMADYDLPRAEPTATPAQPTPTPQATPVPTVPTVYHIPETYTIQYGDSLISISLRFFDTADMVEAIMYLNGIQDPNHIVAGRTIALPRR